MKAKIAAALAMVMIAAQSQASVVTYNFTATITSVKEKWNPFTGAEVGSSTFAGAVVATGQTVRGSFTFDNGMPLFNAHEFFWGTSYSYGAAASLLHRGDFLFEQTGVSFSSAERDRNAVSEVDYQVDDSATENDTMRLTTYVGNDQAHRYMELSFVGADSAAFDGGLPAAALPLDLSERGRFRFSYFLNNTAHPGSPSTILEASGALTSLQQVSSVPEPSTWAMLAGGLGLLAWRRKRA